MCNSIFLYEYGTSLKMAIETLIVEALTVLELAHDLSAIPFDFVES
jgi:hypothetical protein